MSSGLLDQPSTRKRFQTKEPRTLEFVRKARRGLIILTLLINQAWTLGKRNKDSSTILQTPFRLERRYPCLSYFRRSFPDLSRDPSSTDKSSFIR